MTFLQRLNRVTLLFVLLICFAIKVVHAYALISRNDDNVDSITQVSKSSNEILDEIERRVESRKKRTVVVSSNILMVWNNGDGTIGHYNLSHNEFNKLKAFSEVVGTEEREATFARYRKEPKEILLAHIDRRLEKYPNLYVYNKNDRNKVAINEDGEL